jgi:hypothetical protein
MSFEVIHPPTSTPPKIKGIHVIVLNGTFEQYLTLSLRLLVFKRSWIGVRLSDGFEDSICK